MTKDDVKVICTDILVSAFRKGKHAGSKRISRDKALVRLEKQRAALNAIIDTLNDDQIQMKKDLWSILQGGLE